MNYALEAVGIAVAVFVVLLLLWQWRKKPNAPQQPFSGNAQVAEPVLGDAPLVIDKSNNAAGDCEAEVRMLIDYGNKREAIRVVREKMGLDLKDAKELVDKMESGTPIPIAEPTAAPALAKDADHELRQLVDNGRLIEAINRVRQQKGLDLKAAKAYVERL